MAFSKCIRRCKPALMTVLENPPSNLCTQKMHEVQKFVAMTNHGYLGYAVITSDRASGMARQRT
ncbi:MAG: hypothetical protein IPG33_00175 [Betaproteobacteria bacterium]|nr:hypothetical protein [Betaproteobacteria bacterium]